MSADLETMNDLAAHSLEIVSRELTNTLDAARRELEDFVDGNAQRDAIGRAADLLHLAQGALKMVELHGAGMLAEEMERVCRHVLECRDQAEVDAGLEALTKAMVQLPAYLERVMGGGRDIALVLLPLLNDLRRVRGNPMLSEGSLLLLNAGPFERRLAVKPQASVDAVSSRRFQLTARKLRPAFQAALLQWIRGNETTPHLDRLIQISSALEKAASTEAVQQLWFVLTGVLIALRGGHIEPTVTLKRLVGQADRQLKRLIDGGEAAWLSTPPVDLLNSLLYYVARSGGAHERLVKIREMYRLDDVVPPEQQLAEARESLAGPSVKLMRTVAKAIKEDLSSVKDALDIFVRTGMDNVEQLEPQLEMLKKIGDTLGVLGLEKARTQIQREAAELTAIVAAEHIESPGVLEKIAATLLDVEDALDSELIRAVVPGGETAAESESEAQYRHVTQAVVGECIVNLAKVKEAVAQLLESPTDGRALDQVKPQLRGITAGLLMLNKTKAVKIVERVGKVIESRLGPGRKAMKPEYLERLADAVVSVEYYLETISRGRSDPWYMLDNASRCLDLLESLPPVRPPAARVAPEPPPPKPEKAPPSVMEVHEEHSDPELLELFIEEAKEEIQSIQRFLPIWAERPEDSDALISVRRSFHTLKGSGRMVGAQLIGECAWSIENLLNRVINQTLDATPAMVEFIREAAEVFPQLIEQLELGIAPRADLQLMMKRAHAFASGEPEAAKLDGERPPAVQDGAAEETAGDTPLAAPAGVPDEVQVVQATTSAADDAESPAPAGDAATALEADAATAPADDFATAPAEADTVGTGAAGDGRAAEPEPAVAASPSGPVMDPVLSEIFVKETLGHLEALRTFIDAARRNEPPHLIDESVYRACHTLLGSAKMAAFEPAVALARPLSDHVGRLFQAGRGLSAAGLDIVEAGGDEIRRMTEALSEDASFVPDPDVLGRLQQLGEATAEPAAPASVESLSLDDASFDPEIAAIFTEEAAELLEAAEIALDALRGDAASVASVVELQRLVHTLKGGARMAGVTAMGDLSHALETLLEGLAERRLEPATETLAVMQRCFDELHRMRDGIDAGQPVASATELIAQLEAVSLGGPADEGRLPAVDELIATSLEPQSPPEAESTEASVDAANVPKDARAAVDADHEPGPDGLLPEGIAVANDEFAPIESEAALEALESTDGESAPDVQQTETGLAGEAVQPESVSASGVEGPELESVSGSEAAELAESGPAEPAAETDADVSADDTPAPIEALAVEADETATRADETAARADETAAREDETAAPGDETSVPAPDTAAPPTPPESEAAPAADDASTDAVRPPAAAARGKSSEPRGAERAETARVDAALLDELLNGAGEVNIFQSRLNQQLQSIDFHLGELGETVTRLREQLRKLEAETEAQILYRHQEDVTAGGQDFDPLELDRYSTIQQLSRALAETANDVASINDLLHGLTTETETLLGQQARVTSELQEGLMRTRMVPFQRHVSRLARIVRQAGSDSGKLAELTVHGAGSEVDRQVLEAMLAPFEHLLRNAVVHGIEPPAERREAGKPEVGKVELSLRREGGEVLIEAADDGCGLDLNAIRRKAFEQGLIADPQEVSDQEAVELILRPGFSTAGELTQAAGRGVGMDVVDNEIKKLGGSMRIESRRGQGTRFFIRLPYTLAVTHALIVNVGEETFALPLPTIEGVTRLPREQLLELLTQDEPRLEYGGVVYRVQHLGTLVGGMPSALPEEETAVSLVLVRAGESSTALLTDSLEGSREIVVKTLGPHLVSIPGVSGATILGDGRVIVILDAGTLVRGQYAAGAQPAVRSEPAVRPPTALVVDDSITMRRVTQRLLERRGVQVVTARDGLDAITALQDLEPDVILLDIEMPRMDGYQFASHVRNDEKLKDVPIVMITSRSGEKHRAKAIELGVNDYLSKPYQEAQLIASVEALIGRPL